MPEHYLVPLCSASTAALFLYFKTAILPARNARAVLAVIVAITGTLAMPNWRPYTPRITVSWLGLTIAIYLSVALAWRVPPAARYWWKILDVLSVASFIAAAVYSIAQIVVGLNPEKPILTLLASCLTLAACVHILHELDRANVLQRPAGLAGGQTLFIAGIIPLCFGLHRIDFLAVFCMIAGAVILILRLHSFFRNTEERRIIARMPAVGAEALQPEYTEPSTECPEPRLWSMYDPMTAEKEILDLLYAIVHALKPELVVETGTFSGISSTYIARALKENGRGLLVTCENDPVVHQNACNRFHAEGLSSTIDCRLGSSLELEINDRIDLLYCDSDLKIREQEVRRFLANVSPFGLILMHDAGSHFKIVREAAFKLQSEGLISIVLLSSPRGLVIAQKQEGRR